MPSAISPPKAVLGIDVGKSSHRACLVTREGEVALNRRVRNSEGDLDGLFSQVACDTIVVVDQCRNIGLLAISRARLAGLGVAYLPGLAAHQAARLFAGDAKTDERDALVIAKTALGIPDALLPVPEPDEALGRPGRSRPREATWSPAPPGTRTASAAYCWNRAPHSRRLPTWATGIG